MSAWIVGKRHIDALVTAIFDRAHVADSTIADDLGHELWQENHRSVNAQYGERFGVVAVPRYTFERVEVDGPTLLKTVRCYSYQSCEHDGWATSRAFQFMTLLERFLLAEGITRDSPAYMLAPWGLD